jgi:hypothetical protein
MLHIRDSLTVEQASNLARIGRVILAIDGKLIKMEDSFGFPQNSVAEGGTRNTCASVPPNMIANGSVSFACTLTA